MFVAERNHAEGRTNTAGNHVSRTSSLPRARKAVIQGIDCLLFFFGHDHLRTVLRDMRSKHKNLDENTSRK